MQTPTIEAPEISSETTPDAKDINNPTQDQPRPTSPQITASPTQAEDDVETGNGLLGGHRQEDSQTMNPPGGLHTDLSAASNA